MGWAGGAQLADELWDTVKKLIPKDKRAEVAEKWIKIFVNEDCDTLCESQLIDAAGFKYDDDGELVEK